MTKHIPEEMREIRKNLKIMGESIEKMDMNNTIKEINFKNIKEISKNEMKKIIPLIKKYNGVIYGTSIAASITDKRVPVRKTTDLDVKFHNRHDQLHFSKDVMKALGEEKFYIHKGHFGESIKRKSTGNTIIDTAITSKGYNRKNNKNTYNVTLDSEDRFIKMYTKHPKISNYKGIKGESYSTSAQRKIHAAIADSALSKILKDEKLRKDKERRTGKDYFDVRIYNSNTYLKALDEFNTTTNKKRKSELKKFLNNYGRAILNFSANKNVLHKRKITEKKYIQDGMLKGKHFTSKRHEEMEKRVYKKSKDKTYDLTKAGGKWIEIIPEKKRKPQKNVNVKAMI